MTEIKYFLATSEHIRFLVDSRIEFMTEIWGEQEATIEKKLRDELTSFFKEEIPAGTYISWLAMNGNNLVGVGGMKMVRKPGSFRLPSGMSGYIMNIYTIPSCRKRGIAAEIMNRLMKTGADMGVKLFELHSTKDGESVYIKTGFSMHDQPSYRKFII